MALKYSLKMRQLKVALTTLFLAPLSLATVPLTSCNPPANKNIVWEQYASDPGSWYGLSLRPYEFAGAIEFCDGLNSELISVTNEKYKQPKIERLW